GTSIPEFLPGDANRDGSVDVSDLGILATNYDAGSGFEWGDGDFTGDGLVDVSDLGVLATNYGTSSGAQWGDGDFTGDGKVDVSDLGILATNYGTSIVNILNIMSSSESQDNAVLCDLDNDGQVGLGDLAFFSSVYGEQPGVTTDNPYAYAADFDGSGTVDLGDLGIFSSHYRQGQMQSSLSSLGEVGQPVVATPETVLTAASDAVAKRQNLSATSWVEDSFDGDVKVADDDVAILAQQWMMAVEDMDDDEEERDAVFAEVGAVDDMLGLFDE
ncbi:MAG: hypothetical protein U9N87_12070, partial [Planctomycetota bacterium]|nr:hypothetical protein [Planctomycetota bacterium]